VTDATTVCAVYCCENCVREYIFCTFKLLSRLYIIHFLVHSVGNMRKKVNKIQTQLVEMGVLYAEEEE